MESKWLNENQKKDKKFKRNRFIGIIIFCLCMALFIAFEIFSIASAPEEYRGMYMKSSIFSMILIIGIIAFSFVIFKNRFKKDKESPNLKEELKKALNNPEDLKLLDDEIYGDLKREVKMGTNRFTFTPHFFIQHLDFTKYMVIKVQRVFNVKISENQDYGQLEFFDKNENSLGKITLVLYKCKSLYNVCKEQIPWAEFE